MTRPQVGEFEVAAGGSLEEAQRAGRAIGDNFQQKLNTKLNTVVAQGLEIDQGFDAFLELVDARAKKQIDD